ncbi:hypothetical protein [Chloroflexus sp.]|uniref:hypothetical protein n=1 Tax=Chloroflexus sp. TaxID=1904827 RepID=UPI002ACDB91E|nr:hypothetical protein [Chloroflexus sp.]
MPELFQVVTIAEANARLCAHLTPLTRCESLSLHEALDRALAEELRSPVDLPAFPRSTMDGFAARAVDTYGSQAYSAPQPARADVLARPIFRDAAILRRPSRQIYMGDPVCVPAKSHSDPPHSSTRSGSGTSARLRSNADDLRSECTGANTIRRDGMSGIPTRTADRRSHLSASLSANSCYYPAALPY